MSEVININKNKSQYEKIKDIIGHDVDFVVMTQDPNEEASMNLMSNASAARKMSYFAAFLSALNTENIISTLAFVDEE